MPIQNPAIGAGTPFDWGRVSEDYARYRDIDPEEFYQRIIRRGLCALGRRVLDPGSGTGVLPRHLARFGAQWTGTDISPEQIRQAEQLSRGMGDRASHRHSGGLPRPL